MAQWGQALAAAVSGGLAGYRLARDEKERDEDQAWQKEQRDAQRSLRAGLADAAMPAGVDAGFRVTGDQGSDAFTKDADAAAAMQDMAQTKGEGVGLADAFRVAAPRSAVSAPAAPPAPTGLWSRLTGTAPGGEAAAKPDPAPAGLGLASFHGTRADADTAAATYNGSDARAERMGLAYMKAGMPEKALGLADAQLGVKAKRATLAESEQARARESMFRDVTTRIARGGWQSIPEIYKGYNDGNSAEVEEDGKGGATVIQIGPDGKELGRRAFASPMDFIGGHVAALDPKLWVGMENHRSTLARQTARDEQMQRNQDRNYALQVQREERMQSRDDQRDVRSAAAAGMPSREERLRYTSLFSEAGRRMSDAQKALSALRKDPLYATAKPGTPQHQEMEELRGTITQLGEERKTYQSMLAGSQTEAGATAPAPRGAGGSVRPGARLATDTDEVVAERRAIMESELRTAQARGDTETVAAVQRELARLPAAAAPSGKRAPAASGSKPTATTDFSHLWK